MKYKTVRKSMNYVEIVKELNVELYEQHEEVYSYFVYKTNGFIDLILFDDWVLWSSETDDREFDEDKLISFIKKQFNQVVDKMQKFRFEDQE